MSVSVVFVYVFYDPGVPPLIRLWLRRTLVRPVTLFGMMVQVAMVLQQTRLSFFYYEAVDKRRERCSVRRNKSR